DENRLKQVFINLISNALKFTDLGGEVIIKASLKGNNVIFEIIDNGVGIAKEELEKIFEKFSQASCDLQRLNSCGLGIGLALVKNILKDFKSQINVKSEVGKGSNFYFELNLA
ncbi:ATP-binding protein, partial [Candidatus Gracilibacteria bacterium]|nr:ATP-binding protein [Candidatus Gracilibacteria bacterium]